LIGDGCNHEFHSNIFDYFALHGIHCIACAKSRSELRRGGDAQDARQHDDAIRALAAGGRAHGYDEQEAEVAAGIARFVRGGNY
jgi:hypothetical protein